MHLVHAVSEMSAALTAGTDDGHLHEFVRSDGARPRAARQRERGGSGERAFDKSSAGRVIHSDMGSWNWNGAVNGAAKLCGNAARSPASCIAAPAGERHAIT